MTLFKHCKKSSVKQKCEIKKEHFFNTVGAQASPLIKRRLLAFIFTFCCEHCEWVFALQNPSTTKCMYE